MIGGYIFPRTASDSFVPTRPRFPDLIAEHVSHKQRHTVPSRYSFSFHRAYPSLECIRIIEVLRRIGLESGDVLIECKSWRYRICWPIFAVHPQKLSGSEGFLQMGLRQLVFGEDWIPKCQPTSPKHLFMQPKTEGVHSLFTTCPLPVSLLRLPRLRR